METVYQEKSDGSPFGRSGRSMYVVTFYSFKGGVGRTMALSNVAAYLASIGKRVLIVDFDLEAPGLDTISLGADSAVAAASQGVVDFISAYRRTGEVPDVRGFLYSCPAQENGGQLFVMPAGRDDGYYAARLAAIDWSKLYQEEEGFVLFEDMKAQWLQSLDLDYVLIDSRTGHTDVGGICTRQLPDAVVAVFIPNQQNLRGLEKVVEDIRHEEHEGRQKQIALHFVMSNVPDLDDEDEILAGRISMFRRALRMKEKPTIVHRYDSLALLTQSVFTLDRPKSRLAKEYRQLASVIQRANPADPVGALEYLSRVARGRVVDDVSVIEQRLERIRERHSDNEEVLLRLAEVRQRQGRASEALSLLQRSVTRTSLMAERTLALADAKRSLGDTRGAASDARQVFDFESADIGVLAHALQILLAGEPDAVRGIANSLALRAVKSADDLLWISTQLNSSRAALRESQVLLERARGLASGERELSAVLARIDHQLGMVFVGLGRFDEAVKLYEPRQGSSSIEISDKFNYAMALWGRDGYPSEQEFREVSLLGAQHPEFHDGPNFCQCMFVSFWIAGDHMRAMEFLSKAEEAARHQAFPEFSCWRFQQVSTEEFLSDLRLMRMAAENGEQLVPAFMLPET